MHDLLTQWAQRHGISDHALLELRVALGTDAHPDLAPVPQTGASEAAVSNNIRLEASRKGVHLWRNNVGATWAEDGSFIRYGLANDSEQLNRRLKSSDLIGIRPVVIEPAHVGHTIGQFVAREVKRDGWKHRPNDKREAAQARFLALVESCGGDAQFASAVGSI